MFFGKDVTNLTLAEAAHDRRRHPVALQPLAVRQPRARRERRNVVLRAMADAGYICRREAAGPRRGEPLETVVARALDMPRRRTSWTTRRPDSSPSVPRPHRRPAPLDVYTTLDLNLQRSRRTPCARGSRGGSDARARRARRARAGRARRGRPAHGRRAGLVGGRSYNQSQFNRAARAPAARLDLQAVRLPRRLRAGRRRGRADLTPATIVVDEPTTLDFGARSGRRATTRTSTTAPSRCGARWRCRATSPPSRWPSSRLRQVAALWKRSASAQPPKAVPVDRARRLRGDAARGGQAYTLFANGGELRAAPHDRRVVSGGGDVAARRRRPPAGGRPETTFLVTRHDAQRDDEGTGARRARRGLRARRRRQVGHHQRPARRLVRRLHARAAHGGLGGLRRQPAARPERVAGGAAHLDRRS
jgi:hypothetical protein